MYSFAALCILLVVIVDGSVLNNKTLETFASERTSAIRPFSYSGNITFLEVFCNKEKVGDKYKGLFVAYLKKYECEQGTQERILKAGGAIGSICFEPNFLTIPILATANSNKYKDITIPVFTANAVDIWEDYYISQVIYGDLVETYNDFTNGGWIIILIFQIIFIPWNLVNIVFCIIGIKDYMKFGKVAGYKIFWIPILCLVFELIAGLLKLAAGIDPVHSYSILPVSLYRIVVTSSVPFTLATNILINLYWNELASKVKKEKNVIGGVQILKIPFFIACFFLFGFEIVIIIIRSTGAEEATLIWETVTVLFQIFINTFILYSGYKLRKTFGEQWNSESALKKVSNLILYSVTTFPLYIISILILLSAGDSSTIFCIGFSCLGISLVAQSTFQILAFQKKHRSSSDKTSSELKNVQNEDE